MRYKLIDRLNPKVIFFILVALTIISSATAIVLAVKLNNAEKILKQPPATAASEAEVKSLLTAVGRAIVLPTGETPTIATVADPSKLKDQPFFARAKVGDKVLIYSTAQKAILWSPTLNKVVEVSGLTILPPTRPDDLGHSAAPPGETAKNASSTITEPVKKVN